MQVLKPILYFSIFNHPLKKDEILSFSQYSEIEEFEQELNWLTSKGIISHKGEYYHPHLDDASITKRENGFISAQKIMKKAEKNARFIANYFPFVRAVCVSGSLSKGYFDEESDVDFFIIAKDGHLWTCRTLLILYKKIFLLNSKKYFCLNYFLSENYLEIEEKNRFTATEITTLLPLCGKETLQKFFESNQWVERYFPNRKMDLEKTRVLQKNILSRFLERLLSGKAGKFVELYFFKITFNVWKKRYGEKLSAEDFAIAFKSSKKVSKHHPSNFQKKVIDALNDKYQEVHEKYQIDLPKENV